MAKKKIVINKGSRGNARRPVQVRITPSAAPEAPEEASPTEEEAQPAAEEISGPKVLFRKKGIQIKTIPAKPKADAKVEEAVKESAPEETPEASSPKFSIDNTAATPPPADTDGEAGVDDSDPTRMTPATLLAEPVTDTASGEASFFRFYCMRCGQKLKVRRSSTGATKPCPSCAHDLTVPEPFDSV